jgi:ubiquinone/menaquinone biosynthesis C-methylase UbiE
LNNAQSFSLGSEQYAKYRPSYPEELFSFLSDISEQHESAWDCATGNGQAAISCAKYFSHIEATDISAEQIQNCIVHPHITYSVGSAESTKFEDTSFDLIVVAQAFHWFDQERFFREVKRVLRPNGILAVFGYGFFEIDPAIDAVINENLLMPIDKFWAKGNRLLMSGYKDVTLPFEEIPVPTNFRIETKWTLQQLLAYLRTWSAVKLFMAEFGYDPVSELEPKVKPFWRESEMLVQMPIFLKAGRKPS